jgi:hypothetical protein
MNLTKDKTNNAIIVTLSNVRKHQNADRLKLATVIGNQVIVDSNAKDGNVVVYFDSNLCLSNEYLKANNLYSNPELNIDTKKKGYFGSNGRVKAQKFRGEISNGYVAPLDSLFVANNSDTVTPCWTKLKVGDEFTSINGVEICKKYVIPNNMPGQPGSRNHDKKKFVIRSDMFHTHWDTKQLMREIGKVPSGVVWIEEKLHGTSGRTGNVLVKTGRPWYKFWLPKEEWLVLSGTRRVDNITSHISGTRSHIHKMLVPLLHKGETVYYEIFGMDMNGKEIQKGFPYGCNGPSCKVMLYRVTITTPDNFTFDLPREQVYRRADELGLMRPIVLSKFYLASDGSTLLEHECTKLVHGNSALANHIKEGVVVWFQQTDGSWSCLKHKSQEFLIMESGLRDLDIGDPEDVI